MTDGANERKRRLWIIIEIVNQNPGIHRNNIVGIILLREGLTSVRIEQYIDELVQYDQLIEKDNLLYPRSHNFEDETRE